MFHVEQVKKLLQELSFTEHEILTYCGVLQLGECSILEIAKFTGLKRPTIYNTIRVLINRGLVAQLVGHKKRYSITSIDAIKDLIQKQQQSYFNTLPSLLAMRNVPRGTKPTIRYYDGVTQIATLYRTLFPLLNKGETLYTAASMRDLQRVIPNVINEFDVLAIKNQWHIRELLPSNKTGLEYTQANKNYKQKYLPAGIDLFDNDIMFIGDLFVVVSTGQAPYAIAIEDKSLTASFISLFNVLWT
jgi:sugar-specific transcriptional regulator TrmB